MQREFSSGGQFLYRRVGLAEQKATAPGCETGLVFSGSAGRLVRRQLPGSRQIRFDPGPHEDMLHDLMGLELALGTIECRPKALAGFAKKLSQAQRRALGIRQEAKNWYPAPSQPTFSRALHAVDPEAVDRAALNFQAQVRGQPPKEELVALDGKEPKHGGGHSILSAVSVPSQYYLGSAVVSTKTNEIPVARKLFPKLDLEGRFVSLDALHTQTETALDLVQEHGAHYTLTVKDNQPGIHETIKNVLPHIPAAFPPPGIDPYARLHPGAQSQPRRSPHSLHGPNHPGGSLLSSRRTGGQSLSPHDGSQT